MCSSCIERCDSIDLTWIFLANTVATAKHRIFYDFAATAITVMRGNCQVEKHGGDHRDFGKINAVGECFRQKTRELYWVKGQDHSDPKSETRFRSITQVPFDPELSNLIG